MSSIDSGSGGDDCLTEDTLGQLLDRRLSDEALAGVHRHAAECAPCRRLLAEVAQELPDPPPDAPDPSKDDDEITVVTQLPGLWKPPDTFDEFRLERPLGRGGMGVVYLAHDASLDRRVAVKFIASSQPDPRVLSYFETEARLIASLQHPNVVTVFRVGKVDGHPYIVSEYVVGSGLDKLPRPIPWRQALGLGLGLARGLAAAHRQGVLHRDIKPSNAILARDGEVKLLDFGLAERFEPGAAPEPSPARTLVGTMRYMAPELLRRAPATRQSDLYALGLVLYELCTGDVPRRMLAWTEPGQAEVSAPADTTDRGDGAPPTPLEMGVDPDFAAIIEQCIAFDPAERFASVDALREALERLERTHTTPPLAGNPYRGLAPFEAEHRALFFGRDTDIRTVLDRLRRQPVVLVAGDSGAGKSSLCRAGVLPRVAAGALDGRELTPVTLWPGRRPLQALAAALAPVLDRKEAELLQALLDAPTGLGQALREAHQKGRGLLLFIDQLEELITLAEPAQAAQFARFLGELALPSDGVRVLLAVRGDFLTRVCALPGLGDEAERALYILRPMSPEGVREAVVGPARHHGVIFESEELIQTLVGSTAHGAGSLPLLQFALAELWERRNLTRDRLTRAALEEMGGVAGALSRHADGVIARLAPTGQQAARRLLLQLVTAEGTRIERHEEELVAASDEASAAALQALVEGRLVHARTVGGQARYEIAHDSLIESWSTLRGWLDDDIGQRALRQRAEAASAEWERLSRAREALWGQRQLDEARLLDPITLGPRERAFLLASHRALTRRRWGRRLATFLLVLAIAAFYGGLRLQAYLADARFVGAQLDRAREAFAAGRDLGQQASARREAALALFDGRAPTGAGSSPGPHDLRNAAERRWTEALETLERAEAAYDAAGQSLEKALERARGHTGARQLLAEVTWERLLLAERFHPQRAREWARRLQALTDDWEDGPQWQRRLSAPAELALVTEPAGARVAIERYTEVDGGLRREPVREPGPLGPSPLAHVLLPAGSYLLHVTHPGRAPVDLPLLLTRGGKEQVHLALPGFVPAGYAYIPPGCFLMGSADPEEVRGFMNSSPLHRLCIDEGYLIGRTEVTFGDWLTYLDSLPPNAPARHLLDQPRFSPSGAIRLREEPDGAWTFSFYRSRTDVVTARAGEVFRYPGRARNATADWRQFPLSGLSSEDLAGYLYWLDRSRRLPGARLCSEHEWERAARGADGRQYPHGDRLSPDEVNVDTTYDRQPMAYGPDMVGAHPSSMSPFGLHDMAGNAFEMTRPMTEDLGRIVLRGGAWYYDHFAARVANRVVGDPTEHEAAVGLRVCASFSPR